MINQAEKLFLLFILLLQPLNGVSYDVKAQDMYVTGTALAVGALSGYIISSAYHPAALEKAKLEQEQAEKKKKELAEQVEKEQHHAAELKRAHAINLLLQVKHTYVDEFKKMEELHKKETLLSIIKENCGMREMPLNQYHTLVSSNIEALKTIESVLPAEKQQERLTLITNLERILKAYNIQISDKAKAEKDENDAKRKNAEAEQRKVEKEQLELKKLRLEIDNIKETRNLLEIANQKLDVISTRITVSDIRETEHTQEVSAAVNALRIKQAHDHDETKKVLSQINQGTEKHFAMIFKFLEAIHNYLIPPAPPQAAQPQPVYYQYPAPTPSAPPLGA